MEKKTEKNKAEEKSKLFIPAGLLIGLGIGLLSFAVNPMAIPAFTLIGLGIGFLLSMVFAKKLK